VKTQTLYSYVSRGWVRSTPAARGNERLYARADVERLKARGQARAGHAAVAAGALRWGEPILSTSISTIRDVGPVYRGHAATDLVRQGATFESVAELLWSGALDLDARGWTGRSPAVAMRSVRGVVTRGRTPLEGLLAVVPRLALLDVDRFAAPSEAEWISRGLLPRVLIPDQKATSRRLKRRPIYQLPDAVHWPNRASLPANLVRPSPGTRCNDASTAPPPTAWR